MSEKLLSEDAFNNEQSQKLFEVIDELHSCGAKAYLDLPEIVIVGDQSAGKSSLLQSLTDIPFPVAGRLCTRFPTRIVSRRTPGGSDVTKISIEASTSGYFERTPAPEREQKYAKFRPTGVNLSEEDFTAAIDDAMRLMGMIADPATASDKEASSKTPNFSSDVLRIELSGPNRSHFSILDVPGVFQSRTKDVTLEEMNGVKSLVSAEMRRGQSIVVCVASGTSDLATQAIFEMASHEDPAGERTVGVITKCDVTQHADLVVDLARNDPNGDVYFQNGWFVVRNRTPTETVERIEAQERHLREEKLFHGYPWKTLSTSRRGVQALKKHLGDLLCSRMQAAFPKMLSDIQERKRFTSDILGSLGPARSTIEQKRTYLTRIAQRFHATALGVLHGRYESIDNDKMKLRKQIRDANDKFMHELKINGHRLPFVPLPTLEYLQNDLKDLQESSQFTGPNAHGLSTMDGQKTLSVGGPYIGQSEPLNVGSAVLDTMTRPFQAQDVVSSKDRCVDRFHSISSMKPFQRFSFEELRLKDYVQGQSNANQTGGSFGTLPKPTTPNSNPVNSIFATTPDNPTSSIFATTPNRQSPSPFGSNTNGFGSAALNQQSIPSQGTSGSSGGSLFAGFGSAVHSQSTTSPFGISGNVGSVENNRPSTNGFGGGQSSSSLFTPKPLGVEATAGSSIFSGFGSSSRASNTSLQTQKFKLGKPMVVESMDQRSAEIYRWIRDELKANRGTELQGTLNPDILPMLFHQQASKWGHIAETHFLTVVNYSLAVMNGILESTGCHEITRKKIWPRITEASDSSEKEKTRLLHVRVRNITSQHLQTSNTVFEEKITQARLLRFQAALDRYRVSKLAKQKPSIGNADAVGSEDSHFSFKVDIRETAALFAELHMSNSTNLENEIHDTLRAYYEIAREDFIEYVTRHIVEDFINSEDGPVLRFSPLYVAGLSDEDIENLATEDKAIAKGRTEKEATLKRLEHAERIALRYA